jgi:hypothetical protein
MLLSSIHPKRNHSRREHAGLRGFNSRWDACERGLISLHNYMAALSQRLPLAEHRECSFKGRRNSFVCGLSAHFPLREVQHVERFRFYRGGYPVCIQRVRNLVCKNWKIRNR